MPVIEPLILVRGLHLIATVLGCGTVAFMVLVAGRMGDAALKRRLTFLVWAALAVTVLSGFAWLTLVAANILDVAPAAVWRDGAVWPAVTDTRYGQIASLRLAAAGLLALLLALPTRGMRSGAALLAVAAVLAGSLALVGHAGAAPGTIGSVLLVSDVFHLLAASAWLGGLPALALLLASSHGGTEPIATVTARFSRLGIICVGTLLASGLFNSWELLNGPADLWTTTYGKVLSVKIGLFIVMVGVAAVNRTWLTPRLPAPGSVTALKRNSMIEAGLGICVLMLVGALGTMVPGGHVHTNTAPPESEAAFVHIHTETAMADVTLNPGTARKNTAIISLWNEDSTVFAARSVRITLAPREGGTPMIERPAELFPDGTWQVTGLGIPRAGVWILRVLVDTGRGPPLVLDAPIVITQCSNECW